MQPELPIVSCDLLNPPSYEFGQVQQQFFKDGSGPSEIGPE